MTTQEVKRRFKEALKCELNDVIWDVSTLTITDDMRVGRMHSPVYSTIIEVYETNQTLLKQAYKIKIKDIISLGYKEFLIGVVIDEYTSKEKLMFLSDIPVITQ